MKSKITILVILISLSACVSGLEKERQFYMDFINADIGLIRQTKDAGIYYKLANAATQDSLDYYIDRFREVNAKEMEPIWEAKRDSLAKQKK